MKPSSLLPLGLILLVGCDYMIDQPKQKASYTPPDDYRKNLVKFVNEAREKKAIPVLLTPVMRRSFDKDGKFYDTHAEYPDIVRAVWVVRGRRGAETGHEPTDTKNGEKHRK